MQTSFLQVLPIKSGSLVLSGEFEPLASLQNKRDIRGTDSMDFCFCGLPLQSCENVEKSRIKPDIQEVVACQSRSTNSISLLDKLDDFAECIIKTALSDAKASLLSRANGLGEVELNNNNEASQNSKFSYVKLCKTVVRSKKVCWTSLPPEMWLKIFGYISQAELYFNIFRVCKEWNDLCRDASLWKKIDFTKMHEDLENMNEIAERSDTDAFPKTVTNETFKEILSLFSEHISALKMSRFMTDFCLHEKNLTYLYLCKNVVTLDLGFCDVNLPLVCANCQNIKTLILEGCSSLGDKDFKDIYKLQNLNELNVSHCANLTITFLVYLYPLENLRSLICDGVMSFTDYGLIQFFNRQPLMEKLVLDGEILSDEPVLYATANLPHLVTFELSFSQSLTNSSIFAFRGKHQMESLQFRKATNLTASAVCSVFSPDSVFNLKKLTITESEHMTDDALVSLSSSCPDLQSLTLDWCWRITDNGISHLVENCKKITRLSLVGLYYIQGHPWLRNLEQAMPDLTFLDLTDCNNMADMALLELVCRKPQITVYSYYHEKITPSNTIFTDYVSKVQEGREESNWKCPGEIGARVDF